MLKESYQRLMGKGLYILLILGGFAANASASEMAKRSFRAGLKAERAGDPLKALFLYTEAAQTDAKNQAYSSKLAALLQNSDLKPRVETGRDPAEEHLPGSGRRNRDEDQFPRR